MSKSQTQADDRRTVIVRLTEEEFQRAKAEKESMALTWRGYFLQADHSHLRTRAEGGGT